MPTEVHKLGVIARSRPPATRWADRQLYPHDLLPLVPATAPRTLIAERDGVQDWYLGGHDLVLHSGDTGYYRDNLMSARPSVWVALSMPHDPERTAVHMLTADPYEGEGLAGDPGLLVGAVPMPAAIQAVLQNFIAAHHVEHSFQKRRRSPAAASSDRAPRILQPHEKWGRK